MAYTRRWEYTDKIKDLEPFRGSSARAEWEGDVYVVYSYRAKIAAWSKNKDLIFFDNKSYSCTTSCLQNYAGAVINSQKNGCVGSYYVRNGFLYYKKDTTDEICCKHIYSSSIEDFVTTKESLIHRWNTMNTSQEPVCDNPLEALRNKLLKLATD
jgi:hypothetical protein